MAYDDQFNRTQHYSFGPHTFSGGATFAVPMPAGKNGYLMDYGIEGVTTTTTTTAAISIGTVADPDAYGDDLAVAVAATGAPGMKSVRSSCNLNTASGKAAFDLLMVDRRIPAGTQAVLTVVAGGAGVGSAFVDIAWDP